MRDYLQDLLSSAAPSADFFSGNFLEKPDRMAAVKAASQKLVIPAVLKELSAQNHSVSRAVDHSLQALEKGGVALAISGQQLGVCGGPLFTLYKIASTIALARVLQEESSIRVIPLFWLQSEDHDFAEIKSAAFFGPGRELKQVSLEVPEGDLGDCVGRLKMDAASTRQIRVFLEEHSGADAEFRDALEESFLENGTFSQAMARLMQKIFGSYGLLVFDPDRRSIKEAFRDFIASSFLRSRSIGRLLLDRGEKLRLAGYPLQAMIRPDSPLFFVSQSGRRQRLNESSEGMWVGEHAQFSKQSLYEMLEREPERFTCSALIRPVFQDTVFPTCAYVAGPSEFKYLAQTKPLYEFFNCRQPLVVPRARFVVVQERQRRLMQKLGMSLADAEKDPEEVILKSGKYPGSDAARIFSPLAGDILERLSDLRPDLEKLDANLLRALDLTQK